MCAAFTVADVLAIHVRVLPLILLFRRCPRPVISPIAYFRGLKNTTWLYVASRQHVQPLELVFAPARSCALATEPKHVKPIYCWTTWHLCCRGKALPEERSVICQE